jgi:uncharacterized protein
MDRHEILKKLQADTGNFKQFDVATLKLFGSVVRDQAGASSDVDILVRFKSTPNYDRFMDLKFHLETLLGVEVDLVTESALRPEMRQAVEKDALLVA